ncbi:MAG: hypothetical protein M1504_01005 [Candidatus Marsarchaeota archaeon]|nr:hypothetical protein [Candidatus Marsarchaeota archaeon]
MRISFVVYLAVIFSVFVFLQFANANSFSGSIVVNQPEVLSGAVDSYTLSTSQSGGLADWSLGGVCNTGNNWGGIQWTDAQCPYAIFWTENVVSCAQALSKWDYNFNPSAMGSCNNNVCNNNNNFNTGSGYLTGFSYGDGGYLPWCGQNENTANGNDCIVAAGTCTSGGSCSIQNYTLGVEQPTGTFGLCYIMDVPSASWSSCCSDNFYYSNTPYLYTVANFVAPFGSLTLSLSNTPAPSTYLPYVTVYNNAPLYVDVSSSDTSSGPVWLEFSNTVLSPSLQANGAGSNYCTNPTPYDGNGGFLNIQQCPSQLSASTPTCLLGGGEGTSVTWPFCNNNPSGGICQATSSPGAYDTGWISFNTVGLPGQAEYELCAYQGNPGQEQYFTYQIFSLLCGITGCESLSNVGGSPILVGSIQGTACTTYYDVSLFLVLLALTFALIGGALYGGASMLPGQTRGNIRGVAMGLIYTGIAGLLLALLSMWVLSFVTGIPIQTILSQNGCAQTGLT